MLAARFIANTLKLQLEIVTKFEIVSFDLSSFLIQLFAESRARFFSLFFDDDFQAFSIKDPELILIQKKEAFRDAIKSGSH
jgi:hypothetical protein